MGSRGQCLAATSGPVALVLAKTERNAKAYREAVQSGLSPEDLARLTVLLPEGIPDFLASLTAPGAQPETVVKGYRVKVSSTALSPEEAAARREQVARLVSKSLQREA